MLTGFLIRGKMSTLTYMKDTAQKKTPKRPKSGTPRLGKRAKNKEETKERILTAALDLFREKGLDRTTTKEISREAGIAEGTLLSLLMARK